MFPGFLLFILAFGGFGGHWSVGFYSSFMLLKGSMLSHNGN